MAVGGAAGRSWAVLGAGMLGLTLAWRLAQRGCAVTVIEAAPMLGGLTASHAHDSYTWDRYYHVISTHDRELMDLLAELGLEQEVQWRATRTLFFDGNGRYPLDNAADYLRLPALPLSAKLRIALNIVYGSRLRSGLALEQKRAEDWLCAWSGRTGFERLWRPLLRAKLGANHELASAAYIWSVMRRFYGAREGARRTEKFGFIPGGYARIIATLAAALHRSGAVVRTAAPVRRVAAGADHGVRVVLDDGEYDFDRVVVTFASPLALALCGDLGPDERARHTALRHQGVVCLSLLLARPLGGAYMSYITDPKIPFTTIIEMSALTGTTTTGGHHLVYLPKYVPSDDPLLAADPATIRAEFAAGLARLYPDFEAADIVHSALARTPYVMALPTLDYSRRLPPLQTAVAGLAICNSARIVNASLSVNEAVTLANQTVTTLCPA